MSKLYFKYGAMGSSKTAQALITRFNYIERGMKVYLAKPEIDTRDGKSKLRSRIGIEAEANVISKTDDLLSMLDEGKMGDIDVIIVDEAQFLEPIQVDQLHDIAVFRSIPVLCFGLSVDFTTHLFPGSMRLFELAESISEIKTICRCGAKATINARFGADGRVTTVGEQVMLGGNDRYEAMCYKCWKEKQNN